MYAATYAEKLITVDDYENGCETKSTCTYQEAVNITANTLKELVDALGSRYGLAMDDVWAPDNGNGVHHIGFNRLENANGDEPSDREKDAWKEGKLTLWLADYHFAIERRTLSYPGLGDFTAEGIKTHD